jgi:hypothetical protein
MAKTVAELVERELGEFVPHGKISWSDTNRGLKLDVWRHRFYRDRKDGFGWREVEFRISAEDRALAGGHFREWAGPPAGFLEEFFEEADGLSQADHDTADIIQRVWGEYLSPFDYGTLVRFDRLAIRATTRSPDIWSLIDGLIGKEFATRGSMLILKAFPLEFESDSRTQRQRFLKRARAMSRYYQRRLGVRIVPGPYGVEGWMWRALRYCPEPPQKAPRRPRRTFRSHFRIP